MITNKTCRRNFMALLDFVEIIALNNKENAILGNHLEWFKAFNRIQHTIMLVQRQGGKTKSLCVYGLWYAIAFNNSKIVMSSSSNNLSRDMINQIDMMYKSLPNAIKVGIAYKKTATKISVNGSTIYAGSFTDKFCNEHETADVVLIDDLAFWKQKNVANFLIRYPRYCDCRKFIIASGANGVGSATVPNLFYYLYATTCGFAFHHIKDVMDPVIEKQKYDKLVNQYGEMFVRQEWCGEFFTSKIK